jgi:hypothetical protein
MIEEEMRSSAPNKTFDERLDEAIMNVSLKNVPLDERRREASKPLFLTRYE